VELCLGGPMRIPLNRKKAFTLIEVLIVIMIIGLLATVLGHNFSKARENGMAARCKTNLRNLYQAYQSYYVDNATYITTNAWVTDTGASVAWSLAGNGLFSVTNGALFRYTGQNKSSYLCPKFQLASVCGRSDAVRSYVMNGQLTASGCTNYNQEFSRTLLFTELQPSTLYPETSVPICLQAGSDGILTPGAGPGNVLPTESIGCIHAFNGGFYANVLFMDGHIEMILPVIISSGAMKSNVTYAACNGVY